MWIPIALFALCACKPPARDPAAILEGSSLPVQDDAAELRGVTIDRFEGDRVKVRAHVDRARIDRRARVAEGEGISIELRDRDGRVTAGSGKTELEPKTVVLSGGVVATDREGRTISASSLTYDVALETAAAPAPVTVSGQNFSATGGRLIAWTSTGTVEVEGPLRANVASAAGELRRGTLPRSNRSP